MVENDKVVIKIYSKSNLKIYLPGLVVSVMEFYFRKITQNAKTMNERNLVIAMKHTFNNHSSFIVRFAYFITSRKAQQFGQRF